ncbi:ATP-binding protein [Streptomyces sp. NBC_01476]|uniref:ATP-binding protein n=1 Tax=Streptomyces sp. NBC_01476 TaxID=2903881 RepID=UPI002E33E720|nr:ATP-binding protein [Streptomyces sp. NBC_01476]
MRQPAVEHERDTVTTDDVLADTEAVLVRDSNAPRQARRYVLAVLYRLGTAQEVAEAAEVVTSELVTNSVTYGQARMVRVGVTVRPASVTITVSDGAPYRPLPPAAEAGPDDENGRGLFLVEALADRWGHRCAGVEPSDGTAVWAELRWWAGGQRGWGRTRPDS